MKSVSTRDPKRRCVKRGIVGQSSAHTRKRVLDDLPTPILVSILEWSITTPWPRCPAGKGLFHLAPSCGPVRPGLSKTRHRDTERHTPRREEYCLVASWVGILTTRVLRQPHGQGCAVADRTHPPAAPGLGNPFNIRVWQYYRSTITDTGVQSLVALARLQHLDLKSTHGITKAGVLGIPGRILGVH